MDIIQQTNRTILFEQFNPQKLDLLTLVGDVKGVESLNDQQIKEINEHLLVRNFDEFLEKFPAIVYSFIMPTIKESCTHWKNRKAFLRNAFPKSGLIKTMTLLRCWLL